MTAGKRLLVVEDDPMLREVCSEGLRMEGFEVVAVEDGLEAFEAYLFNGPFDALVVDWMMPRLGGRDLLARLRARGENVPALIVSGRADLSPAEQRSLRVGPVLLKPFRLESLIHAIRRLLAPDPA